MYHIVDDPRALRSAELIGGALLHCLEEKEFQQVTVTDLWRTSGVSRATFYRLFDNVCDVLTYQCEQVMDAILRSFRERPPEKRSYQEMTMTILEASMDHADLLDAVSKTGRVDILFRALMKHSDTLRTLYFLDGVPQEADQAYFLNCVCLLISALIDQWVRNGRRQTALELYASFTETLNMLSIAFCG